MAVSGVLGEAQAGFDFLDHAEGVVRVTKELAAAVAFGDFIDGAAHIDVDDVGAPVFGPHGRFAKAVNIAAVKLHGEGGIFRTCGGEFHGAFIFAKDALRAEQIRAGQAHAAEAAGDQPKREIAIAGDGGQKQIAGEADGADLKGLDGHSSCHCNKN